MGLLSKKKKLVIVGNGISGVTLALEVSKRSKDYQITIISGESEYFYSRPALMYIFMGHMRLEDTQPYPKSFWKRQKHISLKKAWATRVDTDNQQVLLDDGSTVPYDSLVLATGSKPNKWGWPGQDLLGVQGFYGLQDLHTLEGTSRDASHAVIVGGGLIGIELAEMLLQRSIKVTFLVREKSYWSRILTPEESAMVNRIIREEGIDLQLETELAEIYDNGAGHCRAVLTSKGDEIPADIVGLTAGVSPNIALAQASEIPHKRGILVNNRFSSPVENVYAIGDCAEIQDSEGNTAIDQLWYTGKMQGQQLAVFLTEDDTDGRYTKPLFYNSAKFFDLEYQVYGDIPQQDEAATHHYWEAPNGKHSLRLVEKDGAIIGVQVMGIRYRHRTCEEWIQQKLSLKEVLPKLRDGNFDPEFYKRFESDIRFSFSAAA